MSASGPRITEVCAASSLPLCTSGMGSLIALHTVAGPVVDPFDLDDSDAVLKELLFHEMLDRGVYFAARGYMALSLAITDADCDELVAALADAIATIAGDR